jgi:hypothetical protein
VRTRWLAFYLLGQAMEHRCATGGTWYARDVAECVADLPAWLMT